MGLLSHSWTCPNQAQTNHQALYPILRAHRPITTHGLSTWSDHNPDPAQLHKTWTLSPVELSWSPADPADWTSPSSLGDWHILPELHPSFVQLVEHLCFASLSCYTLHTAWYLHLIQYVYVVWSILWPWLNFPMIYLDHSSHPTLFMIYSHDLNQYSSFLSKCLGPMSNSRIGDTTLSMEMT